MTDTQIALASLCVAFIALLHSWLSSRSSSRQISEISQSHYDLHSANMRGSSHADYIALLSEAEETFERITSPMIVNSGCVVDSIAKEVDRVKIGNENLYLAYLAVIEEYRNAYDELLTQKQGLWLNHQFIYSKKLIDSIRECTEPREASSSIYCKFIKIFRKKTPGPVNKLKESRKFRENINFLYSGVPEAVRPALLAETSVYTKMYLKLQDEARSELVGLEKRLDDALRKNKFEDQKIEQNLYLGPTFMRLRGDIERFRNMVFQDFTDIAPEIGEIGLDFVIRQGIFLRVASECRLWGAAPRD